MLLVVEGHYSRVGGINRRHNHGFTFLTSPYTESTCPLRLSYAAFGLSVGGWWQTCVYLEVSVLTQSPVGKTLFIPLPSISKDTVFFVFLIFLSLYTW